MRRRHNRKHHSRHHWNRHNKRFSLRRSLGIPSLIFKGIILLVIGVILMRFSGVIFVNWLGWMEGLIWGFVFGIIFLIAGALCFLAWWRNNVLQHRFGLKVGRW